MSAHRVADGSSFKACFAEGWAADRVWPVETVTAIVLDALIGTPGQGLRARHKLRHGVVALAMTEQKAKAAKRG